MSAYKIETWLKKGYTEEEAKYQIAIRRPSNIQYWLNKGYTEEEAAVMLNNHKKLGGLAAAARSKDDIYKSSIRRKEYWINKGYTEEEAIKKVAEVQTTFSKETCIAKYGETNGEIIWKERQEKWQNTLNTKSSDEKTLINKRKALTVGGFLLRGYTIDQAIEWITEYYSRKNIIYFLNENDYIKYIKNEFEKYPHLCLYPIKVLKRKLKFYDKNRFVGFEIKRSFEDILSECVDLKTLPEDDYKIQTKGNWKVNKHGHYIMWINDGKTLLRSSREIYFYHILSAAGIEFGTDYIVEKKYPNSNYRCDFYFINLDLYVELAGSIEGEYFQKMKYKESTFGSKIIWHPRDYNLFVGELICKLL